MVDLDMPLAKVQYSEYRERRDDRAADPTAAPDGRAREDGKKWRKAGVRPRTVGE
jgi:hypothetical protein